MAVKRYNSETQTWEIFPGTAGDDAFVMAQKNGYSGTKEEYIQALLSLPDATVKLSSVDNAPVQGSDNLIDSNAVWERTNSLEQKFTNHYTKSEVDTKLSSVEKASFIEETYNGSNLIGSGKIINNWTGTYAVIEAHTSGTPSETYIVAPSRISQWRTNDGSKLVITWVNNEEVFSEYLYIIKWIGSVVFVDQVNCGDKKYVWNISGTVTYEDGTAYDKGLISINIYEVDSAIDKVITVTTDSSGKFTSNWATLDPRITIQVMAEGVLLAHDTLDWAENIELTLSTLPISYTIKGTIYYSDGPLFDDEIEVLIGTDTYTVSVVDGLFEFLWPEEHAITEEITLQYPGDIKDLQPIWDWNEYNFGDWVLQTQSPSTYIYAAILLDNATPYYGDISISYLVEGDWYSESVEVTDGNFIWKTPYSLVGSSISRIDFSVASGEYGSYVRPIYCEKGGRVELGTINLNLSGASTTEPVAVTTEQPVA